MKKLILIAIVIVGCKNFLKQDYSNLKIGGVYIIGKHEIFKPDCENPFKQNDYFVFNPAIVVIEDMQVGYVKYCRQEDFGKPEHSSYSRSFDEFEDLINENKQ